MNTHYVIVPTGSDLVHFNPWHSPANGQFISGPGGRSSGGIGGYIKRKKAERKAAQLKKQRAANLQKAREASATKRKMDANKERVLKSGTASEVMQYKGQLTNDELSKALNRINWETQLSGYAAKEVKTAWDKMDDISNKVSKLTSYANTAISSYNTIAKIYNATPKGKKKPWTVISNKN